MDPSTNIAWLGLRTTGGRAVLDSPRTGIELARYAVPHAHIYYSLLAGRFGNV